MNVNPIAPRTLTGPLLPIAPVTQTQTAAPAPAQAPAPAPAPAGGTTANVQLNWAQTAPNLNTVTIPPQALTAAQVNNREARLIAISQQLKALPEAARGDKYKLDMERQLIEQELAQGAMPEPARGTFFNQINLQAQYKDLQHQMAYAKTSAEVNQIWSQIEQLQPKVKGINAEDLLGVKDAAVLNRILDLQKQIPSASSENAHKLSMSIKLLQHEDANGAMPAEARQAFMSQVDNQARYTALQTLWVNEKDPAKAAGLWGQIEALQSKVKGVNPQDLLGLKSAAAINQVRDLQKKIETASPSEAYRLGMQIKLVRQEDQNGPMPVKARLAFLQEVNLQTEKKALYDRLMTNPPADQLGPIYARIADLTAKTKHPDPDDLLGIGSAATQDKIADLHAQMDANKPGDTYRLEAEIALLRFEDRYGKVSAANKALFREKADQLAQYKELQLKWLYEPNKAKADQLFAQMTDLQDNRIKGGDPSDFLIAEPA